MNNSHSADTPAALVPENGGEGDDTQASVVSPASAYASAHDSNRGAGHAPDASILAHASAWRSASVTLETSSEALRESIAQHVTHTQGLAPEEATDHALYLALALSVRDRLMDRWRSTRRASMQDGHRRTCYLSMEYLIGRSLGNAIHNLDLDAPVAQALGELGLLQEALVGHEQDAGLGNGGLGRLAACFLDSCATLGLPVIGYGLRYRYGMFHQAIENGHQVERPDAWLRDGHVWEIERTELTREVRFGGHVVVRTDARGREHRCWTGGDQVLAIAFDVPVPGHGNDVVNTLRLWSSAATDDFNLEEFNAGSYTEAVAAKTAAENITMVLYPNDASENGKVLRLRQQYLLVSASLQDVLANWMVQHGSLEGFAGAHCFQLNDTHPSMAVAELMRLLIDEHWLEWDAAWSITSQCMAYTNHTLLPEALECWPVHLLGGLLPRPMEIINEINRRFLLEVERRWPLDYERQAAMAIVSPDAYPVVRMAHLAIVGSFSINGVAALHSRLLTEGLFLRFAELWPERFNNKTNGVTPRRWLSQCNPGLAGLLDECVGEGWLSNMERLQGLAPMADDAALQERWRAVRVVNKTKLSTLVQQRTGVAISPDMLFDVQVKRIHEYKRQLLCGLHAVHCYLQIKREAGVAPLIAADACAAALVPRCILIAGKAAPGYRMAKSIIKVLNNIARVVNSDPATAGRLRVVFLPDYQVSAMERIAPATDLSEQISTAGKEASGTGNMKFMMNGALTIGTLDGANVEIFEALDQAPGGSAHYFRFGLTENEVREMRASYAPASVIATDARLTAIIEAFQHGLFDGDAPEVVREVIAAACSPHDPWLTLADLPAYLDAQSAVQAHWADTNGWTRSSICNTAFSGRFSTDRTMREYNQDIWHLTPLSERAAVATETR